MQSLHVVCASVFAFCVSVSGVHAQERSPVYPYDVTVGGQQAEPPGGPGGRFANVAQPVAPDAHVKVDTDGEQIVVKVFPIDEKGVALPDGQANTKIIMVAKGTGFDLDATLDKSTLAPGLYGMNIVLQSQGKSRVRFVIGTPEQLAAAGKKDKPPIADSPPANNGQTPSINMAGVDRIGGSSVAPPPPAAQSTPPAPAINLYGSERLGFRPPALPPLPTAQATAGADRSTPHATMQLFIDLAKAGKFEAIRSLESPDADGDVREICAIGDAPDEDKLRYQTFFGGGKILGEPRIDGDKAEVDFTMGDKQERKESMNLKRIAGLWFLSHF